MNSIYELKPRFQALLRPLTTWMNSHGVSANQVTLAAMCISFLLGASLYQFGAQNRNLFLLLPLWMFLRMALNAIDGMLAREFNQKTILGAYLNELADVVSDAALYIPFVFILPFGWPSIGLVVFLSALSEMAGILGGTVGGIRRYDGPMGKSDRAFVFGTLGLVVGLSSQLPTWLQVVPLLVSLTIIVNIINRVRRGISAIQKK